MTAKPLISVSGVQIAIGGRKLITGLDLRLKCCERMGLTGRSGLGKSLLIDAIMHAAIAERSPSLDRGVIEVTAAQIGYAPQRNAIPSWFSIGDVLAKAYRRTPESRRDATRMICEQLTSSHLRDAFPRTVSGGEAQRASLALALALADDLLILDEPLSALDVASKMEVLEVTRMFSAKHQFAVLVVSHDLDILLSLTGTVMVLGPNGAIEAVRTNFNDGVLPDLTSPDMLACRRRLLEILADQKSLAGEGKINPRRSEI